MELGLSLGQDNEHDFFEFVQQVCYDTGNALLGYGHHPRPQILHVKKKARQTAQRHMTQKKIAADVAWHWEEWAQIQVDSSYLVGIDVLVALGA